MKPFKEEDLEKFPKIWINYMMRSGEILEGYKIADLNNDRALICYYKEGTPRVIVDIMHKGGIKPWHELVKITRTLKSKSAYCPKCDKFTPLLIPILGGAQEEYRQCKYCKSWLGDNPAYCIRDETIEEFEPIFKY